MIDFSTRSSDMELMDDLAIGGAELETTLDQLTFINTMLGGYGPSLSGVEQLLPQGRTQFSLLDVGCGGADTARRIADWAAGRSLRADITGIDIADTTVDYAQRKCESHESIQVRLENLYDLPDEPTFDVVHAAIVLHHFTGDEAVKALAKMYQLSRYGIIVNDLHRHPVAWASIKMLTRLLSNNRLIRNDAPLSVLRAFSRGELVDLCDRAGLPRPEIAWRPMFRWRVVVPKTA